MELLGRYSKYHERLQTVKNLQNKHSRKAPDRPRVARPAVHKLAHRFEPAVLVEMVRAYEAGSPAHVVARRYGISKSTLLALLDEHDVPKRHRPMTAGEVSAAVVLYRSGLSLASVGEQMGRNPSVIRNALMAEGVELRDSHGRTS